MPNTQTPAATTSRSAQISPAQKLSVAPMLDWTDRHARFFLRLISRHTWLYSEMVTTGALLHSDNPQRFLNYSQKEHPVVLQLGGSDPQELAESAKRVEAQGYDQVNLNVGCPSDRVQSGRFGACLMAEPQLVAECVARMQAAVDIPVTVKHRIGIDNTESYEQLYEFVSKVAEVGCHTFVVHARKAWLDGLSPKENREIPPLKYEMVHQLKQDFPQLEIIINGGFKTLDAVAQQLESVDGVMIGREAYHNPYILAEVDSLFYADDHLIPTRHEVLEAFCDYAAEQMEQGVNLKHMSRHILGLFTGLPGARKFRRILSENVHKPQQGIELLKRAGDAVTETVESVRVEK